MSKKASQEKEYAKHLVLLDTHAIIHRAYHALPDFSNSAGEPTGALYGLITMVMGIVKDLQPDYVVAAYDLPEPTFRHEAFDGYKAGRKKSDDALVDQLTSSRQVLAALNIPVIEAPGFEADDVIGTIVQQVLDSKGDLSDVRVTIASGDMDTMQLIEGDRVQVFTLKRGIKDTVIYNEQAVIDRYQFGPELIADYKGLRGDPSDNIPGIRGIGEKSATQLITTFGPIEDMYKELEKKPEAFEEAGIKPRIVKLLTEGRDDAEFSLVLATIRRDAPITYELPDRPWRQGIDLSAIKDICQRFEFRTLWVRLRAAFGDESDVTQAALFAETKTDDMSDRDQVELGLALWLLDSEKTRPTAEDVYDYTETTNPKEAREKLEAELSEKDIDTIYRQIELPIVDLVQEMTDWGIKLDREFLKDLSREYHTELDKLQKAIYSYAGSEFNIKSPKQLGEILFTQMALPRTGIKKTAGGAISTRESELEKLRDVHPIIGKILEYRELQKLLSTYIDNLPGMTDDDGILHARFIQTGTSTGRFASAEPNLQNIPIRSDYGIRVREAFVAREGHQLIACDYSQVELRVAAIMSGDEYLTRVFQEGRDIHAAVAAKVFQVDIDDVTRDQRSKAKTINFGILYGMGITALQKNLGTSRAEAQEFHNAYFEQFPSIRDYLNTTKHFALKHGYTETLFGRRRYFPALKSRIPYIRAAAERMAINAPIQGTATADIIKLAMKHVDQALRDAGLRDQAHFQLQVHDELVFEVEDAVVEKVMPILKQTMEGVLGNSFLKYDSPVPLVVNIEAGENWGKLK